MTNRQFLLAALVPLAGCASSSQQTSSTPNPVRTTTTTVTTVQTPAPALAFMPVGTFSYATELNGSPLTGVFVIKGTPGAYTGVLTAEGQGEFPLSGIKVDGRVISFSFDTPNGTGTGKLEFTAGGNDFSGGWELAGQAGVFKGKRTS